MTALPGDWIAAVAAVSSEIGSHKNRLIFAMRISEKITMSEYDETTRSQLKVKVANRHSSDPVKRVGDSIFDFKYSPPQPRPSMHSHSPKNLDKDLRGGYALLSDHFYYFGDQAIELPAALSAIFPQSQGHRSEANDPYVDEFVNWIENIGFKLNQLIGQPIQPTSSTQAPGQQHRSSSTSVSSRRRKSCR